MAIRDKVKALLMLKSRRHEELAEYLGISKQALSNKYHRGSFSAEDLIKIADFLGCSVGFMLNDKQFIELGIDDLRQ